MLSLLVVDGDTQLRFTAMERFQPGGIMLTVNVTYLLD